MAFNTNNETSVNENMGWDTPIVDDGAGFDNKPLVVVPEGDYEFTVVKFDKGWQNPTMKIKDGCNKAVLLLKVSNEEGDSLINENILLIKSMEWKLSSFFRAIGQKKHGEELRPDWNAVKKSKGMAHVKVEEYQANDGTTKTKNVIDKFLDPVKSNNPWD